MGGFELVGLLDPRPSSPGRASTASPCWETTSCWGVNTMPA